MAVFDSLKLRYAKYGIGSILACLFMLTGSAYATDAQVTIVNGTSNNCLSYQSCYEPFEFDISPGSTVTWVNNNTRIHTATAETPNYAQSGKYRLNFEPTADNLIGQTNGSNDYSSDIISIPKISVGQEPNPASENFTLSGNTTVPEFGPISYFILVLSIASVIVISTRSHMKIRI